MYGSELRQSGMYPEQQSRCVCPAAGPPPNYRNGLLCGHGRALQPPPGAAAAPLKKCKSPTRKTGGLPCVARYRWMHTRERMTRLPARTILLSLTRSANVRCAGMAQSRNGHIASIAHSEGDLLGRKDNTSKRMPTMVGTIQGIALGPTTQNCLNLKSIQQNGSPRWKE